MRDTPYCAVLFSTLCCAVFVWLVSLVGCPVVSEHRRLFDFSSIVHHVHPLHNHQYDLDQSHTSVLHSDCLLPIKLVVGNSLGKLTPHRNRTNPEKSQTTLRKLLVKVWIMGFPLQSILSPCFCYIHTLRSYSTIFLGFYQRFIKVVYIWPINLLA